MISMQNEGLLDLDLMTTMGAHVKQGENSIGFFGTGLKYAIAVFLRENIEFDMCLGEKVYQFYTEEKEIRGKVFKICSLRGPRDSISLGFTTDLGKNWMVWQAYRELYSNCLDENGEISRSEIEPEDGKTTFRIKLDIDLNNVFLRDQNKEKIYSDSRIEIYEGVSNHIYYRGIRAKDLHKSSKYTYNILEDCTLTEDRLLCYDFQVNGIIGAAITQMNDDEIIAHVITANNSFESSISFGDYGYSGPGETFKQVVDKHQNVNSTVYNYINSYTTPEQLSPTARREKFTDELENLCSNYDIDVSIKAGVIRLTGDLLED